VRFYEEQDGQTQWEAFGDFGQNDVHRQFAIVFKTPPYHNQYITQPVEVKMQLQRTSDGEGSDPIRFTYQPEDPGKVLLLYFFIYWKNNNIFLYHCLLNDSCEILFDLISI